jgi:monothiol glutaredoxin
MTNSDLSSPVMKKIDDLIKNNNIVLFMKGDKDMPMCGFSGAIVARLNQFNVDYTTVNVLEDEEIRQAIKVYTNWPTIPQLYIKSEFIGGCDIVIDMHSSGELESLLKQKNLI